MSCVNFNNSKGYVSANSVWDLPPLKRSGGADLEIVPPILSIYNAKILQPLCNIRNSAMASLKSSACEKRVISYIAAAAMVISALILGSIEAITRLALGIIISPMLLGLLCAKKKSDSICLMPILGLFGALITGMSIGSGMRAAKECFTKDHANIEAMRI